MKGSMGIQALYARNNSFNISKEMERDLKVNYEK